MSPSVAKSVCPTCVITLPSTTTHESQTDVHLSHRRDFAEVLNSAEKLIKKVNVTADRLATIQRDKDSLEHIHSEPGLMAGTVMRKYYRQITYLKRTRKSYLGKLRKWRRDAKELRREIIRYVIKGAGFFELSFGSMLTEYGIDASRGWQSTGHYQWRLRI